MPYVVCLVSGHFAVKSTFSGLQQMALAVSSHRLKAVRMGVFMFICCTGVHIVQRDIFSAVERRERQKKKHMGEV